MQRTLNHKINKLDGGALRIVYRGAINIPGIIRQRQFGDNTLHKLTKAIEIYKIKTHLSPLPIQNVNKFDLRNKRPWETSNVRTVKYGSETIKHVCPKTWELVPNEIKESSLEFQDKIKRWEAIGCTCRLSNPYIYNLRYIFID